MPVSCFYSYILFIFKDIKFTVKFDRKFGSYKIAKPRSSPGSARIFCAKFSQEYLNLRAEKAKFSQI
ncbi:hypothetical protein H740_02182 [Campylobacter showae CC57C]|uniref:Uncharacterized protein n=1 Tax=Campylobacter showae CC57C TaxID=1073353 RepID=M3IM82_9BACT|nr:hypothetical protein H740_02182 [Campylobacter showae CC57C]